jgi:hypothetical protein
VAKNHYSFFRPGFPTMLRCFRLISRACCCGGWREALTTFILTKAYKRYHASFVQLFIATSQGGACFVCKEH